MEKKSENDVIVLVYFLKIAVLTFSLKYLQHPSLATNEIKSLSTNP